MDISTKKAIKKTTSTQFDVLVKELEANPDLARGAPVFGADKLSMEELWQKISRKVNSYGPPQRSVNEWKKIWADLKSRTKKKIAENSRRLNVTGGGPFDATPLTELEKAIDGILLMARAAAPSGVVLGAKRQAQPTAVAQSSPPTLTESQPISTTASQPASTTASQPASTTKQPAPTTSPVEAMLNMILSTPTRPTRNIGVVTPTRATSSHSNSSMQAVTLPRCAPRKRNFQHLIGESAREQAKAAKLQAEASKEIAASSKIQAEATKAISETLVEMLAVAKRQTKAFEEFIQLMKNTE